MRSGYCLPDSIGRSKISKGFVLIVMERFQHIVLPFAAVGYSPHKESIMRAIVLSVVAIISIQGICSAQSVKEQLPPKKERGHSAPPAPRPNRTGPRITIPQLTEVKVVLRDQVRSDYTKEDSEILYFVAEDVYGPQHTLLIPAGSSAVGRLVRAVKSRPFGVAGYVFLTCDYILTTDGTRIPLRAVTLDIRGQDQKNSAALSAIVTSAGVASWIATNNGKNEEIAAGTFLGPIVAAFIAGKNVNVPRGASFHMAVDKDTSTPVPTKYLPEDLPQLIRPVPIAEEGPVRRVMLRMADGNYVFGMMYRKGDYLIVTNTTEKRKVHISNVREIQYLKTLGEEAHDW